MYNVSMYRTGIFLILMGIFCPGMQIFNVVYSHYAHKTIFFQNWGASCNVIEKFHVIVPWLMLSLTVFARNIYRIYWRTQSRIFASRLNTIIVFCWGQCKFLWTLKTIFTEASRLRWILISKVHKNSYWSIQKTVIVLLH
jgi:hypothetical protein